MRMNETIEVDGLAAQAIAAACEDARSSGLQLANYKLVLAEEPDDYSASWVTKGKPQGHRGALPGLPEPSLLIEKRAGRILRKQLSR